MSTQGTMSSQAANYQDLAASKESKLKAIWDQKMGPKKLGALYKRAFVLLLSWDQDGDDLHTDQEVTDLAEVFENYFQYETSRGELKQEDKNGGSSRSPQSQINKYLGDFVYDNDGDDTLLIVYYAGHGTPGEKAGGLKLAGKRSWEAEGGSEFHEIIWDSTEHIIKRTRADVLVIFDCCHAGELEKGIRGSFTHRAFEYLAATSANSTTRKPGPESFTAALIWSLKDLVSTTRGFSTQDLVTKILAAPNFPEEQAPRLCERGPGCLRKIVLAPLSKGPGNEQLSSEVSQKEDEPTTDLTLRFLFNKELNQDIITGLAKELRSVVGAGQDYNATAILWGGINTAGSFSPLENLKAQYFAHKWLKVLSRKDGHPPPAEEHPRLATPPASLKHKFNKANSVKPRVGNENAEPSENSSLLTESYSGDSGQQEDKKEMDACFSSLLYPFVSCFSCLTGRSD